MCWANLNVIIVDHLHLVDLRILAVCSLLMKAKLVNLKTLLPELFTHDFGIILYEVFFDDVTIRGLVIKNEQMYVTFSQDGVCTLSNLLALKA